MTKRLLLSHMNGTHLGMSAEQINHLSVNAQVQWRDCTCGKVFRDSGLKKHQTQCQPWLQGEALRVAAAAAQPIPVPGVVDWLGLGVGVGDAADPDVDLNAVGQVIMPVIDTDPAVFGSLLADFRVGLFLLNNSWIEPLKDLLTTLLVEAVSLDADVSARNICAYQILPGLLAHMKGRKGGALSPVNWMRSVLATPDYARDIIRCAVAEQLVKKIRPNRAWVQPNVETSRAKVEVLMGDNRLSLASASVGIMDDIINGALFAPPMTGDLLQDRIDSLHPPADDRDELPDIVDDPEVPCLQITAEQFRARCYRLNRTSSPGTTGWTNNILSILCDDRSNPGFVLGTTPPNALHHAFTTLGNTVLQGRIVGVGRDLFVAGRLALIPKDKVGSVRPIRVECSISRAITSTISGVVKTNISDKLRPLQFGGGMTNGVEIAARLGQAAFDDGDLIISVDCKNAFNTMPHGVIFAGLLEYDPSLIPYFRFKYGTPSVMRNDSGVIVARTCTGVGQGDPCGSLFFELGMQRTLLALRDKARDIEAEYNIDHPNSPVLRPAKVIAFADDASIVAQPDIAFRLAPFIEEIYGRDRLTLNPGKSYITGSTVDGEADIPPPPDFHIESDGLIMLGVPIGKPHYVRTQVKDKIEEASPKTAALMMLHPRTAMILLMKCINAKPGYVLRTTKELDDVMEFAREFDRKMVLAITGVLQMESTAMVQSRCFLSRKSGGFGFVRQGGMQSEAGQISSRLATREFQAKYFPQELHNVQTDLYWRTIQLGKEQGLEEHTEISEVMMIGMTLATSHGILTLGKRKADKVAGDMIHTKLLETLDGRRTAAWMKSSSNSGMAFMDSTVGIELNRYFTKEEFRCVARSKIGVGPTNQDPELYQVCLCQKNYKVGENPYHGAHCHMNKGLRNKRHTDIRDRLATLLRHVYEPAPGSLTLEPVMGRTAVARGAKEVKADISLVRAAETLVIDVSCVDPGADQYLLTPVFSFRVQDGAAKSMEAHKIAHYKTVVTPHVLPDGAVIPFVVEASGRLGPSALGFLQRVCGTRTYLRSRFISDISMICAISLGKSLEATRERFRIRGQNVAA